MAADAGHRVVLVFATRGDLGEVADGVLAPDEALGERREQEARDAAAVLGAARVEFLPYHDSGMAGEPTNDAPDAFAGRRRGGGRRPPRRAPARGARRRAHRLRRARRLRPPRPHPGARRRPARRRARGHAARLRGDDEQGALPRASASASPTRSRADMERPIPRSSTSACPRPASPPPSTSPPCSTASGRRWPRTRRRSPTSRSSSRCRRDAFALVFGTEWFIRLDETPAEPETGSSTKPARRSRPQSSGSGRVRRRRSAARRKRNERSDDHGAYGVMMKPASASSGTS